MRRTNETENKKLKILLVNLITQIIIIDVLWTDRWAAMKYYPQESRRKKKDSENNKTNSFSSNNLRVEKGKMNPKMLKCINHIAFTATAERNQWSIMSRAHRVDVFGMKTIGTRSRRAYAPNENQSKLKTNARKQTLEWIVNRSRSGCGGRASDGRRTTNEKCLS